MRQEGEKLQFMHPHPVSGRSRYRKQKVLSNRSVDLNHPSLASIELCY